ncbi:amidohydrolase [Cryptococcus neoformans Bt85]|nr:amidohydrolase [Cryptococcus neoformans var. grubii Bt85]
MPIQARNTASRLSYSADVEKTPLNPDDNPPDYDDDRTKPRQPGSTRNDMHTVFFTGLGLFALALYVSQNVSFPFPSKPQPLPDFITKGIEQCEIISRPPPYFERFNSKREKNDRFVPGTKSVWLKNGTVWTGEDDGNEILQGVDLFLENGVIRKMAPMLELDEILKGSEYDEVELHGAWVTPGIVDTHSHMGLDSAPGLKGSSDTNSHRGNTQPWLRSFDSFNTHDLAFNLSISGGITTMLVLPGSAGSIGGQAAAFKPRWTYENTPQSMQVEPPFVIDSSGNGTWQRTHSWRHIKHACGENPARVYGAKRMDAAYDFRKAYAEGKKLKDAQDRWCADPKSQKEPFPTSLEYEVLADVIRGNVKVNIHCYETTDLNTLVRISNEYGFPIAAFHHAHEVYLVPDLLKQAWGPVPPAVAIFATNARYKREAYRGTEFAPKILADNGLSVIMKSDHPVLDSRYLVYEASQAHHYGLNFSHSLGAVTTHPAKAMGLDHRLGYVREGYDADLVVWDSFPLSLGATPEQTYIDGIPQILKPHVVEKPAEAQKIFPEGKWDDEIAEAIITRGDPDRRPKKSASNILFQGVTSFYLGTDKFDLSVFEQGKKGDVVVKGGEIICVGKCIVEEDLDFEVIDLKGGSIAPGMISVGSYLGLMEIRLEKSTTDGKAHDSLQDAGEYTDGMLVRAVDGAQFGGKDELLAYSSGVTTIVAYPISSSLISGLSFSFSPSAPHPLARHAIQNPSAALHLSLENTPTSISSKIAILRRLLLGDVEGHTEVVRAFKKVANGELRLVVEVSSADVISALVRLKREVGRKVKITILGGHESWLIAQDLADEDIGVIVAPARSYPEEWGQRRIIPGPPLSNHTLPSYLVSHGVKVGLGIVEEWQARNTRYDAAWVYANSPEIFSKSSALALVSDNLEELLGLNDNTNALREDEKAWVAYEGDLFGFEGRVRGVRGYAKDEVDLF